MESGLEVVLTRFPTGHARCSCPVTATATDLVPKENVERWLKYLRNEFPTVAFKASTQTQRTHIGQSAMPVEHASAGALSTSECLGACALPTAPDAVPADGR